MSRQSDTQQQIIPGIFSIDMVIDNVQGYYNPSVNWNGYLCPWLTLEAVKRVSAVFKDGGSEFTIDGDSVFHTNDGVTERLETMQHDKQTLYQCGCGYVWQLCDLKTYLQPIYDCVSIDELSRLAEQWYPANLPPELHLSMDELWHEIVDQPEYKAQAQFAREFSKHWESLSPVYSAAGQTTYARDKLIRLDPDSTLQHLQTYLSELAKSPFAYHLDDDPEDVFNGKGVDTGTLDLILHNHSVMWNLFDNATLWDNYPIDNSDSTE